MTQISLRRERDDRAVQCKNQESAGEDLETVQIGEIEPGVVEDSGASEGIGGNVEAERLHC